MSLKFPIYLPRQMTLNIIVFSRMCKGYMYQKIKSYKTIGKKQKATKNLYKKKLGKIFKKEFHLNAFQVRQGKGTSNNGK